MCGNSCMSGHTHADFGLCAPKANILRIHTEYSLLLLAFVSGLHVQIQKSAALLSTRPTRARNFVLGRARGCRAPAARPASLHVCTCGNGVSPTQTHSVTCCGPNIVVQAFFLPGELSHTDAPYKSVLGNRYISGTRRR